MKKMKDSYSKLVRAVRALNLKDEVELVKEMNANYLMLLDCGKAYRDNYLRVANEGNALFVSDRSFFVNGGIAVIKSFSGCCMKIGFIWFEELYEEKLNVELFWWFGECNDDSLFCVRFPK